MGYKAAVLMAHATHSSLPFVGTRLRMCVCVCARARARVCDCEVCARSQRDRTVMVPCPLEPVSDRLARRPEGAQQCKQRPPTSSHATRGSWQLPRGTSCPVRTHTTSPRSIAAQPSGTASLGSRRFHRRSAWKVSSSDQDYGPCPQTFWSRKPCPDSSCGRASPDPGTRPHRGTGRGGAMPAGLSHTKQATRRWQATKKMQRCAPCVHAACPCVRAPCMPLPQAPAGCVMPSVCGRGQRAPPAPQPTPPQTPPSGYRDPLGPKAE